MLISAEISSAQDSLYKVDVQELQYDTNSVRTPVTLDKETVENYKNDPDFNYEPPEESDNWWTDFKSWISDVWNGFWNWVGNLWNSFWQWLLGDTQNTPFWSIVIQVLPYLILAILIAFVVWLFFKLNPGARLLYSKEKPGVFFSEEEEIIKTRDIKKLIDRALRNKNYRLAVRYYYLFILKKLTDAALIEYEFDKTNSDYFAEITSEKLNTGFRKATNLYDYIWYGNFTVTESDFNKAQSTFQQLEQNIPSKQ